MKDLKVVVMGLGYIGLPTAALIASKGIKVHGVDINKSIVNTINEGNIHIVEPSLDKLVKHVVEKKLLSASTSTKKADVYLKPDQVSLAIGKGGFNIRLAGQLTGYEIDVYRDTDEDEDVSLTEFLDEIDEWIIDVFKNIGCDTAKSVLELNVDELAKRTDLEEQTIIEVQNILKSEFES